MQTARKMLYALTALYEVGCTSYKDFMNISQFCIAECSVQRAKEIVSSVI